MSSIQHDESKKRTTPQKATPTRGGEKQSHGQAEKSSSADALYRRACRLIETGKYDEALGLLNAGAITDMLKNVKGVCLLRKGEFDAAVRVFRNLVFQTGATWLRPETPVVFQTNLCTALLLRGQTVGCIELLAEITDQQHPAVLRLRQAIETWKRELSFWQRLRWRCGLEPKHSVRLDFPPGDYEGPPGEPNTPGENSGPPNPRMVA